MFWQWITGRQGGKQRHFNVSRRPHGSLQNSRLVIQTDSAPTTFLLAVELFLTRVSGTAPVSQLQEVNVGEVFIAFPFDTIIEICLRWVLSSSQESWL